MMSKITDEFIFSLSFKEQIAFWNTVLWQLIEKIGWVEQEDDYSGFLLTQKGVDRLTQIANSLSKEALTRVYSEVEGAPNTQKANEYLLIALIHEKFITLAWITQAKQKYFHTEFTDKGMKRLCKVAKKFSSERAEKVIKTMQRFHL